jgi:hypothetical protein
MRAEVKLGLPQRGAWTRLAGGVAAVAVVSGARLASLVAPATVDWDENTFILVAQRLTVGELPFTTTFENKPPLFSALQAIPLLIAPDSLLVFRWALIIVVTFTALALRRSMIASGAPRLAADLIVPLVAVASMASPSGSAWMSQHSANLWLSLLLLVILGSRDARVNHVLAGMIASVLVLTRTSYVLAAAGLLILMVARSPRPRRPSIAAATVLGGAIPGAVVLALYAVAGELAAFRAGVIDVVLGSGGQGDLRLGIGMPPRWLGWSLAALVLIHLAGRTQHGCASRLERAAGLQHLRDANGVISVGLLASIMIHGSIFTHYLQMLILPLAVGASIAVAASMDVYRSAQLYDSRTLTFRRLRRVLPRAATLGLGVALLVPSGMSVDRLVPDRSASRAAFEAEIVAALRSIRSDGGGSIWAIDHHFVYWKTGSLPPHPLVTHPSSLSKPEFWASIPVRDAIRPETGSDVVSLVLSQTPSYIIGSANLDEWYLRQLDASARELLLSRIEADYRIVWRSSFQDAVIRVHVAG